MSQQRKEKANTWNFYKKRMCALLSSVHVIAKVVINKVNIKKQYLKQTYQKAKGGQKYGDRI